jgi:hypothetical protein
MNILMIFDTSNGLPPCTGGHMAHNQTYQLPAMELIVSLRLVT